MRLSGYSDTGLPIGEIVHAALAEVTLCATPVELRGMAEFFLFCANEMERMGGAYDHIHLSDRMKEFRNSPHLVVTQTGSQTELHLSASE